MKTAVVGKVLIPGRVLLGPKKVGVHFARIVALKDGSGSIECFNPSSGIWSSAPDSLTFNEVWSAPVVSSPEILARIGNKS